MHHLRVKLHPIELAAVVGHRRLGSVVCVGQPRETFGQGRH